MLFTQNDYGTPISQELSDILKNHTTKDDRANVSIETGVSFSTIRDVVYRNNSLTESNAVAIEKLLLIAKGNCESAISESTETINTIETIIESK